ncbi:MAG: restriction endonuclease, partial [Porphyromonadaceae bacterium]|nr:restriction endonuclease [Porphyromonadaceae bacterium]
FSLLIKRAISSHISEIIAGRLKAAVQAEEQEASAVSENEPNESQDSAVEESAESKIVTTEEELEAYQMVRAILAKEIDPRRVYYRDTQSYFTIIIDDNNRKNVCRLLLDSPKNQRLILIDPQTKEQTTYKLENIADLYHYMDKLIEIAKQYM